VNKLEIAKSIVEFPDKRHNAGGLKPIKKYTYKIEGVEFSRSAPWWHLYKTKTEGHTCNDQYAIASRLARGWSIDDTFQARLDESRQAYKRRKAKEKGRDQEKIDSVFDYFLCKMRLV